MKVGEYIRTKYGITQFKEYDTIDGSKLLCMPVKDGSQGIFANVEDVIKSSPNIIDLIEENDLIHYEYYGIEATSNVYLEKGVLILGEDEDGDEITLNDIEIKSIVTKEQFERMEYRIGE